jgi:hypothetical protein
MPRSRSSSCRACSPRACFDLAFIDGSHVFEQVLSDPVHADAPLANHENEL